MTATRKYKSVGVGLTHEQLAWLDARVREEREKTGLPVTRSNYIQRLIEAEKRRLSSSQSPKIQAQKDAAGLMGKTRKRRV